MRRLQSFGTKDIWVIYCQTEADMCWALTWHDPFQASK